MSRIFGFEGLDFGFEGFEGCNFKIQFAIFL